MRTVKKEVVNCFQIIIFVTSEATMLRLHNIHASCELLSNYYLCDVRSNKTELKGVNGMVVNCFQIIIFVTSEATDTKPKGRETQL